MAGMMKYMYRKEDEVEGSSERGDRMNYRRFPVQTGP